MPAIETSDLRQTAVLWPATGYDSYGEHTVGAPVELRVRWLNQRSEALAPDGSTIAVDATVILARDVSVGDKLWLGTLDDLPGTGTGYIPDTDVMEVVTFSRVPDIDGRLFRRRAEVKRFRDTLPEG